jgi:hypothetical protein
MRRGATDTYSNGVTGATADSAQAGQRWLTFRLRIKATSEQAAGTTPAEDGQNRHRQPAPVHGYQTPRVARSRFRRVRFRRESRARRHACFNSNRTSVRWRHGTDEEFSAACEIHARMARGALTSIRHVTAARSRGISFKPSSMPAASPHRPERYIRGKATRTGVFQPASTQPVAPAPGRVREDRRWHRHVASSRLSPAAPARGDFLLEKSGSVGCASVSCCGSSGDCVTDRCSCRAGNSEGIISVHGPLFHRVSPLYRLATDLSYVRRRVP